VTHIVVVGGGITGLASALELADAGARVTLLEASDRLGGNIRTSRFAGLDVDEAADAFLARVPEGVALARRLGLSDELVSPAASSAYVWARGELRRLPAGTALGVPGALLPVARSGILSVGGMARAAVEPLLPRRGRADDALGPLVAGRFGREVVERLVDPLIGGINAGTAEHLSASAVAPQIDDVARRSRSLLLGLRAERRAHPLDPSAPVFFTVRGGMGAMVDALAGALRSTDTVEVSLSCPVATIEVDGSGVSVRVDASTADRRRIDADGVVLACPSGPAAAALTDVSPRVAATLRSIEYASVALVTLAFPDTAIGRDLDASGLLVPKPEQRTVTACSWASTKWSHWRIPGQALVRASAGRDGDAHALDLADGDLVEAVLADLRRLMAVRADPTETRVSRWIGSFPQYRPGHLDRVAAVERTLATELPQVMLAGAAYRGLGIPACVRQGQVAARGVLTRLREGAPRA
jgi:oxygen-dependent protoporphyrinogen oxidase